MSALQLLRFFTSTNLLRKEFAGIPCLCIPQCTTSELKYVEKTCSFRTFDILLVGPENEMLKRSPTSDVNCLITRKIN